MSYGFGIFGIFGLLLPIVALVAGITALKVSKVAGWMMIAAPVFSLAAYVASFALRDLLYSSSGLDSFYIIFAMFPVFGQALFLAGVFMILMQAKAIKKRAEEQQMLLDEITSRQ